MSDLPSSAEEQAIRKLEAEIRAESRVKRLTERLANELASKPGAPMGKAGTLYTVRRVIGEFLREEEIDDRDIDYGKIGIVENFGQVTVKYPASLARYLTEISHD